MKKNIIAVFCLICFTSLLHAQTQKIVLNKIVAKIGGEVILLSDIEEQYAVLQERNALANEEAKCDILQNIMLQKLFINQAILDSIEVKDEEVEQQLDSRIDHILGLMNNDYEQFEAYYGQSVSEVRKRFSEDLKNQMLAERMRTKALESVHISPSTVVEFYNTIPKDSMPYFNAEVEISELVIKPKVNAIQKAIAYKKLEEIKTKILEGAAFDEMASKYSDDGGSARAGGELGWMKRGSLVAEYEAAAYNLEKNEISEIVESQFGLHLIQLLDRRGNSILTRHILIKPEITEQDNLKTLRLMDSIKTLIVHDSMPFTLAVKKFGDKEQQSYYNGGRLMNPQTGTTIFETGQLEPDIYFMIDTMEVNQVSNPVQFQIPGSGPAYRMILLQSRTSPHSANLDQDYNKIAVAAKESKKNELLTSWIEDKLSKTYHYIDPEYAKCPNMRVFYGKKGL